MSVVFEPTYQQINNALGIARDPYSPNLTTGQRAENIKAYLSSLQLLKKEGEEFLEKNKTLAGFEGAICRSSDRQLVERCAEKIEYIRSKAPSYYPCAIL